MPRILPTEITETMETTAIPGMAETVSRMRTAETAEVIGTARKMTRLRASRISSMNTEDKFF